MTLFSTLNIAKNGLQAHQRALQTTSRNVANASTPGYSRQRAVFEPVTTVIGADTLPKGGGVKISEIRRIVDLNVNAQLQEERSSFAFDEATQASLARLEGIVDETGGAGINAALNDFFAALNDLASDSSQQANREQVVQAGTSLVGRINSVDARILQLETDLNDSVPIIVGEINQLSASLAQVNRQLILAGVDNQGANELRDRRDALLEELATKIDITTFERPNGTTSVFGAGFLLVDETAQAQLQASTLQPTALGDPTFFNVFHVQNGTQIGPITNRITGGELGAALNLRDNRIQSFRQDLDTFAFSLADRINTVHLAGRGVDDATARNFFVDGLTAVAGAPPGATLPAVLGSAGRIAINPDLLANARHVAAGTPAAGAAQQGDNTNALSLAAVQAQSSAFFAIGDPVAGPATGNSQTLNQFFGRFAGSLGAELLASQRALDAGELAIAELEDRRAEVSGVSIDEEVTNLVRFQRGFEASARVLSTIDEVLQQLLSI